MIKAISSFVASHPKIILIAAAILLIPSIIGFSVTFVNYDIMSYLPQKLESVQGENILDEEFGCAANAFLVIQNMESKDVVKIKKQISGLSGVKSVTWADDILDINIPASMLPDVMTEIFYSADKSSTLLMIQFDSGSASDETMEAIRQIKKLMNDQCFLSGMSAIMEDTKELADKEAPIYIAIAIILALTALSLTMDSWLMPVFILASLGFAVIYNMGTNWFFPNGISYITQCIAAILQLGVTMDYSVFLIDRFDEEKGRCADKTSAMKTAIETTFRSLTGSSMTTVFGFLALCFMSFSLGADIGIVMAKGVLLGVATVIIVLPAFLLIFDKPISRFRHKRLIPGFGRLNIFLANHKKSMAVLFLVLLVPSYIAKSAVELDYCIEHAMPEQLDSIKALSRLKDDFNMATTHFVIVNDDVPQGEISEMTEEFKRIDGITNVISLGSYVGPAIAGSILPDEVKSICMSGGYQLMMVNSAYTASTPEQNAQLDELDGILKKYDPNGYLTGEGALSKDLITVTDRDFKVTSIISIAAIFLLIAISFRSAAVPVILVLSIELAIFINEAIPLFTGANVSFIAPTVISCVQLGATVDYAILLTTRFREELQKGKDKRAAIIEAANASDRSVFQSALVFFCATFGVSVTCNIEIVSSLCLMLARGAVISALVIILFLPPLLLAFEKPISLLTAGWPGKKEKTARKETVL